MMFGGTRGFAGRYVGAFLRILCKFGMCVIVADTLVLRLPVPLHSLHWSRAPLLQPRHCPSILMSSAPAVLILPLWWGAGRWR
jgi:hypothetical protein